MVLGEVSQALAAVLISTTLQTQAPSWHPGRLVHRSNLVLLLKLYCSSGVAGTELKGKKNRKSGEFRNFRKKGQWHRALYDTSERMFFSYLLQWKPFRNQRALNLSFKSILKAIFEPHSSLCLCLYCSKSLSEMHLYLGWTQTELFDRAVTQLFPAMGRAPDRKWLIQECQRENMTKEQAQRVSKGKIVQLYQVNIPKQEKGKKERKKPSNDCSLKPTVCGNTPWVFFAMLYCDSQGHTNLAE